MMTTKIMEENQKSSRLRVFSYAVIFTFLLILSLLMILVSPPGYYTLNLVNENNGNREIIRRRMAGSGDFGNTSRRVLYLWNKAQHNTFFTFNGCKYSNCALSHSDYPEDASYADVVLVPFNSGDTITLQQSLLYKDTGWPTVWLIISHESSSYPHNKWHSLYNEFDGDVTFTRDALVYYPWGKSFNRSKEVTNSTINYAANKTKGAFAYVSNCDTVGYNRLKLMKELGKYIDVDIFGECTGKVPCPRGDTGCEARLHSQYYFYLSWENSLCRDYITEKFWKVLKGDGFFVPVALGGLTTDEYTDIAPPNSFLHVYNFSTIEQLGGYMNHLKGNSAAFNKYHKWRSHYHVERDDALFGCKLCEIANFPQIYKVELSNVASKFNDKKNCRDLKRSSSCIANILSKFFG